MSIIRIRLDNSSCDAYVRGCTGTRSRNETVYGTYSHRWRAHGFKIEVSGNYRLYVDHDRNGSFAEHPDWSDINGNFLPGNDLVPHIEGHGTGAGFKIATDDIYDGNVNQDKTSSFEEF